MKETLDHDTLNGVSLPHHLSTVSHGEWDRTPERD
jgi:hypothetical protein